MVFNSADENSVEIGVMRPRQTIVRVQKHGDSGAHRKYACKFCNC